MLDHFISTVHAGLRSLYVLISESMSDLEYLQVRWLLLQFVCIFLHSLQIVVQAVSIYY